MPRPLRARAIVASDELGLHPGKCRAQRKAPREGVGAEGREKRRGDCRLCWLVEGNRTDLADAVSAPSLSCPQGLANQNRSPRSLLSNVVMYSKVIWAEGSACETRQA